MTATPEELIQFAADAANPASIRVREVVTQPRDGRSVNVVHNMDLRVAMKRAEGCDVPQVDIDDPGVVVIGVGIDSGGDPAYGHNEVHYETGYGMGALQLLDEAIAALQQSRVSLLEIEGA